LKSKLTLTAAVFILVATGQAAASSTEYTGITSIRYASAYCESGGNIHAISKRPAGVYRGKWQFDQTTWRAYAPPAWKYADPAYAPEWVQDRAALAVPYDAWPNC
jgi:Transglycosylase-like domain